MSACSWFPVKELRGLRLKSLCLMLFPVGKKVSGIKRHIAIDTLGLAHCHRTSIAKVERSQRGIADAQALQALIGPSAKSALR